MSNEFKDELMEYVSDTVGDIWSLTSRPDLEKDCVDYVWEQRYMETHEYLDDEQIKDLVIKFLSNLCRDAVSSQDIEYMAQQQRGNDI